MIKLCNSCQKEKPIEEFSFKCKQKNTRHSKCKICHRKDSNNHYKNNSEKYITAASEKKKQIRNDIKFEYAHRSKYEKWTILHY